ncbi:MAG: VacJ family lipoprotein [Alphaproteobacteria bacterium]|nr:VacJ family lipoprotein [Alphaproteobacteria bacterium]MCB9985566.1 VacJ family lipoprotein [Micavibrio sp.]
MVLKFTENWRLAFALVLSTGLLSACASSEYGGVSDPIEGVNRGIFKFNDAVDQAVLKPVAEGYRAVVPSPARTGVRNALRNLKTPTTLANNLLQADLTGAGDTLTRFFANTLFGFGGLVDVAGMEGVNYREEDFGQTLGVWGAGHGPYLVLPLLGPSSVRDTTGLLVDGYTDPVRLWLVNTDREGWYYGRVVVTSVDKREALLDVLSDLKKNSVDYYAAMRSAYIQKRDAQVRGNDDADLPDIP